jgi:hypothetical protein
MRTTFPIGHDGSPAACRQLIREAWPSPFRPPIPPVVSRPAAPPSMNGFDVLPGAEWRWWTVWLALMVGAYDEVGVIDAG